MQRNHIAAAYCLLPRPGLSDIGAKECRRPLLADGNADFILQFMF